MDLDLDCSDSSQFEVFCVYRGCPRLHEEFLEHFQLTHYNTLTSAGDIRGYSSYTIGSLHWSYSRAASQRFITSSRYRPLPLYWDCYLESKPSRWASMTFQVRTNPPQIISKTKCPYLTVSSSSRHSSQNCDATVSLGLGNSVVSY